MNFRHLKSEIQAWENAEGRLVIAAQHTISVCYLPGFIARLQDVLPVDGDPPQVGQPR